MSLSVSEEKEGKGFWSGNFKIWRIIGAVLMAAGLILLGYAGWQKALVAYHQYQLRKNYAETEEIPETVEEETFERVVIREWQPMRIIIPKIDVDLVVQQGDVFDMELHDKGPVHFGMSDLPSTEGGNTAIAGHRGTRWGFFTDVDLLEEGDEIYLDVAGYRFIYLVEWIKIVDPYDWSVIDSTDYPAITLQTCEPKYSSATHRLIVRGALDRVTAAPRP